MLGGRSQRLPALSRRLLATTQPRSQVGEDGHPDLSMVGLDKPRILITGALGQLGNSLAQVLRGRYGRESVVMSDIVKPPRRRWMAHAPYMYIDVLDAQSLEAAVVNNQIDWIVHFSAVLSAVGEQNVPLALKINVDGLHNILNISKQHSLRVFIPSTIGAFGPSSPKDQTPDICVQRPQTIYGVSKVHAELLGEYFNQRYGLDYRGLRFPGVISATEPGGGTTDYAVQVFYDALSKGSHTCYLRPDTRLPMMYIEDCLRSVVEVLEAPEARIPRRTYNVSAMAFTPEEMEAAIRAVIPSFRVHYEICPVRQAIADSWPNSLDDSGAREHWGWAHRYDLPATVREMLRLLGHQRPQDQRDPKAQPSQKPLPHLASLGL